MDQREGLAANIIDLVEDKIRKKHHWVDTMANQLEGNTLLHGVEYYDLEAEIAEMLKAIGVTDKAIIKGLGSQTSD